VAARGSDNDLIRRIAMKVVTESHAFRRDLRGKSNDIYSGCYSTSFSNSSRGFFVFRRPRSRSIASSHRNQMVQEDHHLNVVLK
jgi:hypothetical protein